ncbi:MAG: pilus assembly protein TadG-related protein [Nocardioides sp.]
MGAPTTRDERGAVAIMFAVCALALFAVSALAVDLGNGYERRREVQSQADLAALSAAAALPDKVAALAAVCRSEVFNQKVGQDPAACATGTAVLSATTTDSNPVCPGDSVTQGKAFVYFFATNAYRMKVCSPPALVSFGMARALPGVGTGMDVHANATVISGTPGAGAGLPFYGVAGTGCDYGAQALTDPANGQAQATLPADLDSPVPAPNQNVSITALTPGQIDSGLTTATLHITGSGLSKVTAVGYYRSTSAVPSKVEPGTLPSASDSTGKSVDFAVPLTVLQSTDLWYVRVYQTGQNSNQTGWSTAALPLRVGDPVISCGSLSSSGNFGSLKLPRTDSNDSTSNGWMANNIIAGPQSPLSLAIDPAAASPWTCADGTPGVVYSTVTGNPLLKTGTNCLTTDTGLTSTAATSGFITGTTLFPTGRLAGKPTATGITPAHHDCGPNHTTGTRVAAGIAINNDTLTCFMTDPTMPISTIASPTYAGPAVLDPAIFSSPRFCYVPILRVDPSHGRSLSYSIVDMRPCFITGETNTSTYNAQTFVGGTGANNGVTMSSTGTRIQTLGVVFINRNALPTTGAQVGDYIGVGPKSVQLVD